VSDSSEPENKPPLPEIYALPGARPVSRQIKFKDVEETAKELGLSKLSRPILMQLSQLGIDADGIGVARVAQGWMLVSYEGLAEVMEAVREKIRDTPDVEGAAALANCYSGLVKAGAAVTKSNTSASAPTEKPKGRKSWAKGENLGPTVDVKAA